MAKVITERALRAVALDSKLEVDAAAYSSPSEPGASKGAKWAIAELFPDEAGLLQGYRSKRLSASLKKKADLLLVMEHRFLEGLPSEKTRVLKDLVGSAGDVADPWEDLQEYDPEAYANVAHELRELIEANVEAIARAAGVLN
jgi:protein-tyrosine-phosphatase